MEEIYVPAVRYFSKATGGSSSDQNITHMERKILTTLGFRLNPVTLVHFTDWYTRQWDAFATQFSLHQFCDNGDISFRTFTFSSY